MPVSAHLMLWALYRHTDGCVCATPAVCTQRAPLAAKVANYQHDVVIHGGDNLEHAEHVERLIGHTHPASRACDARAWLVADTLAALHHKHVRLSAAVVVGTFGFALGSVPLGRLLGDVDVAVGPRGRRASHLPAVQKGPLHLTANVDLMGRGPWLPFGNLTDDDLASNPRYHLLATPSAGRDHGAHRQNAVLKVARPELAYLKKCAAYRPKDVEDLKALHKWFSSQRAHCVRAATSGGESSPLVSPSDVRWDWGLLREVARPLVEKLGVGVVRQRCLLAVAS
jgi:hypothetical protein